MQTASAAPYEIVGSFWRNRGLIWALIQREVLGRYRGSLVGLLWSFLTPIFMLLVYTFVFSVVFKARWNVGSDSKTEFSLLLFAGLIVYNLFAECINRAPSMVLSNANYVKKVVFPLEILPWVTVGSALFHALVSLIVWLLAYLILFGLPHLSTMYLPIIFLPLILFIMGAAWTLAALGVYLRDVSQFIGIVTTMMLFLSPVFYPASALPEKYRVILYLNPLTPVIEQTRAILYFGEAPDWLVLALSLLVSLLVAWFGFYVFQRTRKGFADVI
ncbi:MAG: ABC transporter permease [Burkholderiaceae bacterium]